MSKKTLWNFFVVSVATTAVAQISGCGRADDDVETQLSKPLAEPRELSHKFAATQSERGFFADATGIVMKDCEGNDKYVRIDPAGVPADKKAKTITLEFCVLFDAETLADKGADFFANYATGRWGVQINPDASGVTTEVEGTGYFKTAATGDEAIATQTASKRSARIKIVLDFTTASEIIPSSWIITTNGRSKIVFKPYYITTAEGDVKPGDNSTVRENQISRLEMKTDIGVIRDPAIINKTPQFSSNTISFSWAPPADTSSILYSESSHTATGEKSTISSYILMVWDHEKCASDGVWKFKTNSGVSAVQQELTCTYPANIETADSCALTTATCTGQGNDIHGENPQNIAVPFEIPATVNDVVEVGCYKVYRVSGQNSSKAVAKLENGKRYGAFVWPVDSGVPTANLGRYRSGCAFQTPLMIPGASAAKDPGGKDSEDCFVVTAASGGSNTLAVHYWRVIRDLYLEGTAFKQWYFQNGRSMAQWLNRNASLKPLTNSLLTLSGWAIVEGSRRVGDFKESVESHLAKLSSQISEIFFPVAKANEEQPNAEERWSGSSWSHISFSGGLVQTSKDKELYDAYYDKKMPRRLMLSQTFRLLDAAGELNVGYGFSYTSLSGSTPEVDPITNTPTPAAAVGKTIGFYSLGAYGIVEYRLRIGKVPYFWPRISGGYGYERFREDQTKPSDYNAADGANPWKPKGRTVVDPIWFARFALEFSLAELGLGDRQALRDGYGANEFALSFYGEYLNDVSSKRLSLSGIHMGLGVGLLLP